MIGHWLIAPHMSQAFIDNRGTFLFTVLFTTVAWLVVTYMTQPENDATLEHFFRKVRPGGAWGKFRELETGHKQQALLPLVMCWVGGIVMTYSILFSSGKLLFGDWTAAGIWAGVALAGFLVLRHFLSKASILDNSDETTG